MLKIGDIVNINNRDFKIGEYVGIAEDAEMPSTYTRGSIKEFEIVDVGLFAMCIKVPNISERWPMSKNELIKINKITIDEY